MIYKSERNRVVFEPGDTIRCKNADDAGLLTEILCERQIPWEFMFEKDGQRGIWIVILEDEGEDERK